MATLRLKRDPTPILSSSAPLRAQALFISEQLLHERAYGIHDCLACDGFLQRDWFPCFPSTTRWMLVALQLSHFVRIS